MRNIFNKIRKKQSCVKTWNVDCIASVKGFTLMEVVVSIGIFAVFLSLLISSYSSIVKSQREANDYRVMYSQVRQVFGALTEEFREGMIDYGNLSEGQYYTGGQQKVLLVSKDAVHKSEISYLDGKIYLKKGKVLHPQDEFMLDPEKFALNGENLLVKNFQIYVSPALDPYDNRYVNYDIVQFHPKVTIYAEFEYVGATGEPFSFELQTTVSSRIYNQVYSVKQLYQ